MGLHSPFGYVGYVYQFGTTIVDMLDRFCSECHTNRDYNEDCGGCPVGNLILSSKDYISDYYIRDDEMQKPETKALFAIKEQVAGLEPGPLFDAHFIFEKSKPKDALHELSLNLKWFKNLEDGVWERFSRLEARKRVSKLIPKKELLEAIEKEPDLCAPPDLYKVIDELADIKRELKKLDSEVKKTPQKIDRNEYEKKLKDAIEEDVDWAINEHQNNNQGDELV